MKLITLESAKDIVGMFEVAINKDALHEIFQDLSKLPTINPIATIDEMIEEFNEGIGYASEIRTLERLKERLSPNL